MKKESNINFINKAKSELSVLLNKIPDSFASWDFIKVVKYKKIVKKALKAYESNSLEKVREAYSELSGFY